MPQYVVPKRTTRLEWFTWQLYQSHTIFIIDFQNFSTFVASTINFHITFNYFPINIVQSTEYCAYPTIFYYTYITIPNLSEKCDIIYCVWLMYWLERIVDILAIELRDFLEVKYADFFIVTFYKKLVCIPWYIVERKNSCSTF